MHAYLVKDWVRVLVLLSLTCLVWGVGSNNLTKCCMDALYEYGGVSIGDIAKKLVCIDADGASAFQGN